MMHPQTIFNLSALIDIAFMALIIYAGLIWFKRRQAAFVLTGVLIVFSIYLLSIQFNLYLTTAVLDKFFAVIFIALVVIFQEELRHFFEQVAVWSLNRRFTRRSVQLTHNEVEILVRTVIDFAREKIGALIVIKGKDAVVRHLDGGINLNGELSEPLLKSIFDPHSLGHDGAVILDGNQVMQFSCHLPLSKNLHKIRKGGTRHAAALGLAELTDAMCLVVSEERGAISLAVNAEIFEINDAENLTSRLEDFYQKISPRSGGVFAGQFWRTNLKEKILALLIAFALWLMLVAGPRSAFRLFTDRP